MKKIAIIASMGLMLASCGVNPDKAKHALESQGIKNPVIGGYAFFGCDEKDNFRSSWTGTGADGKPVSGVICGGILKGLTVRFD
jgi:hypothetical protein